MAQLFGNELISRAIRRAGGTSSPDPLVLEDAVLPVVIAGDVDDAPYQWKRSYFRWWAENATAGVYSRVMLFVPDESGYDHVVRVVRKIYCHGASGIQLFGIMTAGPRAAIQLGTGPASPVVGVAADQSNSVAVAFGPAHYGGYQHTNGISLQGYTVNIAANAVVEFPLPRNGIILRRGAAVEVCAGQSNAYIGVGMYWDDYDVAR